MKKSVVAVMVAILVVASVFGHYIANISFKDAGPSEVKVVKEYEFENPFNMPEFEYGWYTDLLREISLPYRYSMPLNYDENKKYPIIMFFHGNGSIGTDNSSHLWGITNVFSVAGDIAREAIVVLPQTPDEWSVNGNNGSLDVVKRLTDNLIKEKNGDKDRIYITGLSLGGFATWDILAEYPDYFAAAVPVCGGVYTRNYESYVNTPIWTYHGNADNIVPYQSTKTTYDWVIEAGGKKIKLIELNGIGHNAWDYAYRDREMLSWLFSQKRGGNQSLDYIYRNYFEIVSGNKVLAGDNDILEYFADEENFLNIRLKDSAAEKIKTQYMFNPNTTFTLKIGGQKLYNFKIFEFSKENILRLEKTIDETDYSNIFNMFSQNYYFEMNKEYVYTEYTK